MVENNVDNDKLNTNAKKIKVSDVIFYSVCLFIIIFSLFTSIFWVSLVSVRQTSMNPTFVDGDVLILNKLAKFDRGDVVVFKYSTNDDYIKRIVAIEGDTIFSIDGEVYITSLNEKGEEVTKKLEEDYLFDEKSTYTSYANHTGEGDIEKTLIPEGYIYVLGDNRRVSKDSRHIGLVKIKDVKGVITNFSIKSKNTTTKLFGFLYN